MCNFTYSVYSGTQCVISQTVCNFPHSVSQIYALLSVKFSGLKACWRKEMTNMKYGLLFDIFWSFILMCFYMYAFGKGKSLRSQAWKWKWKGGKTVQCLNVFHILHSQCPLQTLFEKYTTFTFYGDFVVTFHSFIS